MAIISQRELNYLHNSRDSWKQRSLSESKEKRASNRQAKYYKEKFEEKDSDLKNANTEIDKLKQEILFFKKKSDINSLFMADKKRLILLIMHLASFCRISFRSIPRVLETLCEKLDLKIKVPHFTTIIFWQQKLGLYLLSNVGKIKEKWCLIMDISIKLGGMKVLLILRVKMDTIKKNGGAIKASDCQVIGVFPGFSFKGERIFKILSNLFKKVGYPVQFLTDGGSELKKAIEMLKSSDKKAKKIRVTRDIGHLFANILKNKYAKDANFIKFLTYVNNTAKYISLTQLAHLTPPKIRTKGRFQSLSRVFFWANSSRYFYRREQRNKGTKYQSQLKKGLSWLVQKEMTDLIDDLFPTINVLNTIQKIIKTQGVSQNTFKLCMLEMKNNFMNQDIKEKAEKILRIYMNHANYLRTLINVSTDIIESIFGMYKSLLSRSPTREIRNNVLIFPTITGTISDKTILKSLTAIRKKDLEEWSKVNFPKSFLSKRRKVTLKKKKNIIKPSEDIVQKAELKECA